jgi:radical SAM superfamily enzyme YgiQ (UPF0313 family)
LDCRGLASTGKALFMKVLLISENRCRKNLIPYPLGISYIAAAARQAGHEVSGLDLMFSDHPLAEVTQRVRSFGPHCIGLSIRNVDNQDMHRGEFYLPQVREIVETVKSESDAPVVLGGAGFTIFARECLEYLDLEMGVTGEGERSFVELLRRLESGTQIDEVPGLAIRRNGKVAINSPGPQAWPGIIPLPDREIFEVRPYNYVPGKGPPSTANLQARRGCHMRCIYCTSPRIEGRLLRTRKASSVADELASLERDYGSRNAVFVDSLFNYPVDYTMELCREIGARDLSLRWHCNLNPLYCQIELLEKLRETGCASLSIGNESGSEDILQSLKKGFSKQDVIRVIGQAKRLGFYINCFLLLGGPGENEETVKESVELFEELEVNAVRVTVGIRIYPGCELYDIALREGVISPQQNLLYPTFYISPETSRWLYAYMRDVCDGHEGWFL